MPAVRRYSGFTLIELLVVCAIIGLLVGLLLPAVQAVRESARRSGCANQLRQMALATLHFESTHRKLPAGWLPPNGQSVSQVGWSAQAQILPFLDEHSLYRRIDFSKGYDQPLSASFGGEERPLQSFAIPVFLCPSDPVDGTRFHDNLDFHPLNYAANAGTWFVYDPADCSSGDGVFTAKHNRRLREITDGLSHTLMFAEVKVDTPYMSNAGIDGQLPIPDAYDLVNWGGEFHCEGGHTQWLNGRCLQSGFTTVFGPNQVVFCPHQGQSYDIDWSNMDEGASATTRTYAAVTARSYHRVGVNSVMVDGSARFVSDSIASGVWRSLSTRARADIENNF